MFGAYFKMFVLCIICPFYILYPIYEFLTVLMVVVKSGLYEGGYARRLLPKNSWKFLMPSSGNF